MTATDVDEDVVRSVDCRVWYAAMKMDREAAMSSSKRLRLINLLGIKIPTSSTFAPSLSAANSHSLSLLSLIINHQNSVICTVGKPAIESTFSVVHNVLVRINSDAF
jgi:hypothetical protein